MKHAFARFLVPLFCIALAGTATAASPGRSAGPDLCVLTPADFRTFGTIVESKPQVNVEQNGENVYCVYRGKSGATGGVELDVFYPAGANAADVKQTFKTVLGSDPGARYLPEGVPGADESVYSLSVPQPGSFPFAANAVRRGDLVFSISLPSSPLSKTELLQLSAIVLNRIPK
jgi:hypothetical protein